MKINELANESILRELFTQKFHWQWEKKTDNEYLATFDVNDILIGVRINFHFGNKIWIAEFGQLENNEIYTDVELKQYNARKILTTVIEILEVFVNLQKQPPAIRFSAVKDTSKTSMARETVYRHLLKQKLPSYYRVEETHHDLSIINLDTYVFELIPNTQKDQEDQKIDNNENQ